MRNEHRYAACACVLLAALLASTSCRGAGRCSRAAGEPVRGVARGIPPSTADTPVAPPRLDPAQPDVELLRRLRARITREFRLTDARIDLAVAELRATSGERVHLSHQARAQLERQSSPSVVSIHVTDVAVEWLFEIVASELGLAWEARDGAVWLCTPAEARFFMPWEVHYLGPAVAVGALDTASEGSSLVNGAAAPAVARARGDLLARTIRLLIDPEVWEQDMATIKSGSCCLTVRAPPATQDKIRALVAALAGKAGAAEPGSLRQSTPPRADDSAATLAAGMWDTIDVGQAAMTALNDACIPAFISTGIGWELIVRKDQHARALKVLSGIPGIGSVVVPRK